MIDCLFLAHPRSIGETYREHWHAAARFGLILVGSGIACLIHALVPALFTRTASNAVKQLYGELRRRQPNFREEPPAYLTPRWQPEYEI